MAQAEPFEPDLGHASEGTGPAILPALPPLPVHTPARPDLP